MPAKTIKIEESDLEAWNEFLAVKKQKDQLEANKAKFQNDWENLVMLWADILQFDKDFHAPWITTKSKTAPGTPKHKILVYLRDGKGRTLAEIKDATALELTEKKQSHLFQLTKSNHVILENGKYSITELGKTDAAKS